ncbi:MAG TPA: AI-2E family transporter [Nitrospirae bacterium]|nr:AI-2E family transporter [Nitrospirota bacterium]
MSTSTPARLFTFIFIMLVVGGILYFLSLIGGLVKLAIIAALLAYILDPMASMLEARGMSRLLATAIIFVGIIALISGGVSILLPLVKGEITNFASGVGSGKATEIINTLEQSIEQRFSFFGVGDLNLIQQSQEIMKRFGNQLLGYTKNIPSLITSSLIIPFIMFFLLKDGREIIKQFISLMPNRYFELTLTLIHKTDRQLGGYIRGQLIDSAIIGFLSGFALWFLDVKYFIIIGVFTGVANLVPFIGPIVGAVPAIIVALIETGDIYKPLAVVAAFTIVQLIDNAAVKPIVVAKMVSLHPIVVLLAVIIGGKFFGIMGMLVSIPVVGITKVIVQETVTNVRKYQARPASHIHS